MDIVIALAFIVVALVLIALVLLAILNFGISRLESSTGIARDGLTIGKAAPAWSLPDVAGQPHKTPSQTRWQLLVFSDHSLASFPDVVPALNNLQTNNPDLEVLLMSRDDLAMYTSSSEGLDIKNITAVLVDQPFYDKYKVRVMPYFNFIDPQGVVQMTGLVNQEPQLLYMWRMAKIKAGQTPLEEATR